MREVAGVGFRVIRHARDLGEAAQAGNEATLPARRLGRRARTRGVLRRALFDRARVGEVAAIDGARVEGAIRSGLHIHLRLEAAIARALPRGAPVGLDARTGDARGRGRAVRKLASNPVAEIGKTW